MDNQRGGNTLGAALLGFALGTLVGATAVIFKDPENRKAAKDAAVKLDKETKRKASELQQMIADAESTGRTNLAKSLRNAAKQLEA